MKLINCVTRKIESENDWPRGRPPYAILSHTWDPDGNEVTYSDYLSGESGTRHKNWVKVHRALDLTLAGKDGLKYVWIDSCCIDKSSSAELSEAINSMFQWYAEAVVCYAQVADFSSASTSQRPPQDVQGEAGDWLDTPSLSGCRWFRRGWTLQELLAPRRVEFYDRDWRFFGARDAMSAAIAMITGIDQDILQIEAPPEEGHYRCLRRLLRETCVAKRMSWASFRYTSRLEDQAYSLLGIFGITMPLVYGEGRQAFIRLQREIMKDSLDLSLFAWQAENEDTVARGILAHSAREFSRCGSMVLDQDPESSPPFGMTNKGLQISTHLGKSAESEYATELALPLNCRQEAERQRSVRAIKIQYRGHGTFCRVRPHVLGNYQENQAWVKISGHVYIPGDLGTRAQFGPLVHFPPVDHMYSKFKLALAADDAHPSPNWFEPLKCFAWKSPGACFSFIGFSLKHSSGGEVSLKSYLVFDCRDSGEVRIAIKPDPASERGGSPLESDFYAFKWRDWHRIGLYTSREPWSPAATADATFQYGGDTVVVRATIARIPSSLRVAHEIRLELQDQLPVNQRRSLFR